MLDPAKLGVDTTRFNVPGKREMEIAQGIAHRISALAVELTETQQITAQAAVHLITAATASALGTALGFGVVAAPALHEKAQEWIEEEIKDLSEVFNTNLRASKLLAEMIGSEPAGRA